MNEKKKKTHAHVIIIASFALCTQWSLKNQKVGQNIEGHTTPIPHIVHILDPKRNPSHKIPGCGTAVIIQLMPKSPINTYMEVLSWDHLFTNLAF